MRCDDSRTFLLAERICRGPCTLSNSPHDSVEKRKELTAFPLASLSPCVTNITMYARTSIGLLLSSVVGATSGLGGCGDKASNAPNDPRVAEKMSQLIGPEGGTLVLENATLLVPPGAVAAPTAFSAETIAQASYETPDGVARCSPLLPLRTRRHLVCATRNGLARSSMPRRTPRVLV